MMMNSVRREKKNQQAKFKKKKKGRGEESLFFLFSDGREVWDSDVLYAK